MDYKKVLDECKVRAELYRKSGAVWNCTHEEKCAAAITELLKRAEGTEEKLRLEKEARACSIQSANMWRAQRDDAEARAEAAEAENKRWSRVCEAQERRIAELETRAKKADEKLEAAVSDLLRAEEAAEETNQLLNDEVHPACDYSLYLSLHDSVSGIVNWARDDVWRGQKEE